MNLPPHLKKKRADKITEITKLMKEGKFRATVGGITYELTPGTVTFDNKVKLVKGEMTDIEIIPQFGQCDIRVVAGADSDTEGTV